MFRRIKQYAKKIIYFSDNSKAVLSPSFIVRKNEEKTEITIWPTAICYSDILDVKLGDFPIHVVVKNDSLKFYISGGEMYLNRAEITSTFYLKMIECLNNSEIHWKENKVKFLINALKENEFDEISFIYAGIKSEKHHKGLIRYFVRDAYNGDMKYHIWAKDEDHLLEILEQKNIKLSDVSYEVNMRKSII